MGTPVAIGSTLLVSTAGSSEPQLPTFASALTLDDKDHDGRISRDEFQADKDWAEHFGWLDADGDGFITEKEWNVARGLGMGDWGAIAIDGEKANGQMKAADVRWRFKKNLPYISAPIVYQGVYFMVRDGGVITSLNPTTGELIKQGRTKDALGEYLASPVAADGKVFLASSEGKITVLKAGGEWEVLAVNDLGEDIHATPALSEGKIFVRTHGALYCFAASH